MFDRLKKTLYSLYLTATVMFNAMFGGFKKDTRGVGALISIAIVAAILVVLFEVIPVIGYNTSTAVTIPTTSMWNSGTNLNIANGSELWSTNSPMISVGLLIGVIAVIIGLLMSSLGGGMAGGREGGGL